MRGHEPLLLQEDKYFSSGKLGCFPEEKYFFSRKKVDLRSNEFSGPICGEALHSSCEEKNLLIYGLTLNEIGSISLVECSVSHMSKFQELVHKVKELSVWVLRNTSTICTCVVEGNLKLDGPAEQYKTYCL